MNLPALITPKEAREVLKVGKNKLSQLIAERRVEAIRLGARCVRIKTDSVVRLLEG